MAEVKNQYIGLSKAELERERKALEARIYAEKQKVISKDAPDLLRRQAAYLHTLGYNLSMLRKAERELQQAKPSLDIAVSSAAKHANTHQNIKPQSRNLENEEINR